MYFAPDPWNFRFQDFTVFLRTDSSKHFARPFSLLVNIMSPDPKQNAIGREGGNNMAQSSSYYNSEAKDDEEDDPIVTADDMQGIISSFHQGAWKETPVNNSLLNEYGSVDKSDPRHKEEHNPGGSGIDACNCNGNEFIGLYMHWWFELHVLFVIDLF